MFVFAASCTTFCSCIQEKETRKSAWSSRQGARISRCVGTQYTRAQHAKGHKYSSTRFKPIKKPLSRLSEGLTLSAIAFFFSRFVERKAKYGDVEGTTKKKKMCFLLRGNGERSTQRRGLDLHGEENGRIMSDEGQRTHCSPQHTFTHTRPLILCWIPSPTLSGPERVNLVHEEHVSSEFFGNCPGGEKNLS